MSSSISEERLCRMFYLGFRFVESLCQETLNRLSPLSKILGPYIPLMFQVLHLILSLPACQAWAEYLLWMVGAVLNNQLSKINIT